MDNFDLTLIVAAIAAASPFLSSLCECIFKVIHDFFRTKQAIRKDIALHRRDIYERFLSEYGKIIYLQYKSNDFSDSFYVAYYQSPKPIQIKLDDLKALISSSAWDKASYLLAEISADLQNVDIYKGK